MWGYGESTNVVLELQFGPIDMETREGELTLLNDAFVTAEGADLTFFAGPAGTYNAATEELKIEVKWEGYDDSATYKWVVTPQK